MLDNTPTITEVQKVEKQIAINGEISQKITHMILTRKHGPGPYRLIYCDPPWKFGDSNRNGNRGASCKYDTMTVDEMIAWRPFIDSLAAKDCVLAMWWVAAMPHEALDLVKAWGFTIWNMQALVWHKQTANGKEFFGLGRTTRPSVESCLFARRGKPKVFDRAVRQRVEAKVREHSRKPCEAREKLIRLFGDVKRIELFARESSPGFDAFGNQVGKFDANAD